MVYLSRRRELVSCNTGRARGEGEKFNLLRCCGERKISGLGLQPLKLKQKFLVRHAPTPFEKPGSPFPQYWWAPLIWEAPCGPRKKSPRSHHTRSHRCNYCCTLLRCAQCRHKKKVPSQTTARPRTTTPITSTPTSTGGT